MTAAPPAGPGGSLEFVSVACDWCGTLEGEPQFSSPDRLMGLPGQFQVVRCPQCGLRRQNPRLAWNSLTDYYPEGYDSYARLNRELPHAWLRLDKRYGFWKHLRAVERFCRGGRLLDVGCGTGLFLEEAQRSGRWELTGVEPTPSAAVYAARALGVPVHNGRFGDVDLPDAHFDVITLWNVLEHVEFPVADLRRAHRLLKPGGWLVFSVPHFESVGARLFGERWVGWDLPRHLYVFPVPVLAKIMAGLGFRLADTRCLSTSYDLLGHSLDWWSQDWPPQRAAARRLMLRLYHTAMVRALLVLPLWAVDRLKQADILTVFVQKVAVP